MARMVIVSALLVIGVLVMWLSAFGVWRMNTVFDRLHYLGPASTLGVAVFGVAMLVQEWPHSEGFKGLLAMLMLAVLSPLVTHAVALASRTRTFGAFEITPEEEPKK